MSAQCTFLTILLFYNLRKYQLKQHKSMFKYEIHTYLKRRRCYFNICIFLIMFNFLDFLHFYERYLIQKLEINIFFPKYSLNLTFCDKILFPEFCSLYSAPECRSVMMNTQSFFLRVWLLYKKRFLQIRLFVSKI